MTSPLEEHLDRFQTWLRGLADAPEWSAVRMVDARSIQYGPVDRIPKDALCTVSEYEARFAELLAAGYSWLNLAALAVHDGILLVTVERPRDPTGAPPGRTSVNFSGPPLDVKTQRPIWSSAARVRIVD